MTILALVSKMAASTVLVRVEGVYSEGNSPPVNVHLDFIFHVYTLFAARNEPLFSEILLSFWKKIILKDM